MNRLPEYWDARGALHCGLDEVWRAYQRVRGDGVAPFHAAARVAANVDRLGLAFTVGYSAALERLVPDTVLPCALCVTEDAGNHPRAIKTLLTESSDGAHFTLDGTKSFVTFGSLAATLIVAARVGERPDGRPEIAVVRIPADREGVRLEEAPPIPIVPEIPHTRVSFQGVVVRAAERLQGDGYANYVKPFRTVEDIHVFGAATAYLLGLASRSGAPADWKAELYSLLVALERLGTAPALDPGTHVALHGAARTLDRLLDRDAATDVWDRAPTDERERWERDRKLLRVAQKARDTRFQKAVSQLGLPRT